MPAIVTGHGSAPSTCEGVEFYSYHALLLGSVVLSFEKRGTGESSGDYVPFSLESSNMEFNKLAADMGHAVRWLAKQPGIDTKRIGLLVVARQAG